MTSAGRRQFLKSSGLALSSALIGCASAPVRGSASIVIERCSLIDGNGGPPATETTIIIRGDRIAAIGPTARLKPPSGATVLDAAGGFVVPGFIDTNVHLSMGTERRYFEQRPAIALEHAQRMLKHGVTTLRDTFGYWNILAPLRARIASGEVIGPRLLIAGNIVGWSGIYSWGYAEEYWVDELTDEMRRHNAAGMFPSYNLLDAHKRRVNSEMTQGVGEALTRMDEAGVRAALREYIGSRRPDFIKYAANGHFNRHELLFSPAIQQALVDEAHRWGLRVDVHAMGFSAQEVAIKSHVDLVQHIHIMGGEVTGPYPPSELDVIARYRPMASLNSRHFAPAHREGERERVQARYPGWNADAVLDARRRARDDEMIRIAQLRQVGMTPRLCFANDTNRSPDNMTAGADGDGAGVASLRCIEGLVGMGFTAMEAIICATRNGAEACNALDQYGTIEVGKLADLIILEADPLANIANIHRQRAVMKDGRFIDTAALPVAPVAPSLEAR